MALISALAAVPALPLAAAPVSRLPDGGTARHAGPGIARAWYGEPTGRYAHGVLGDAVEAGALVAEDRAGGTHVLRLAPTLVFEDLTPRLADLDGDGGAEIVTIRSHVARGAGVAVYRLTGEGLALAAATPFIGRANRWLNIAGIADFNGDGAVDIALVRTPHIGGTLEIWSWREGGLVKTAALDGFSNHFIGSRNLALSRVIDANGDGRPDLVIPDARRGALRIIALSGDQLTELARVPLPGPVSHIEQVRREGDMLDITVRIDGGPVVPVRAPVPRRDTAP